MNYARLSIDELAALCFTDAGARQYAGEHFAEIVNRQYDEIHDRIYDGEPTYEPEPFPWLDDNIPLEWWLIS